MQRSHQLVVVALLGLALVWRMLQARGLILPAWVDSVHHALLVRILLERGGLPDTWGPYLPEVPFYYHFGFHITAAAVAWATGANPGVAVLVAGQIWQWLMVLAVYVLGFVLWGNAQKALVGAVLVCFVSEMPAYYVAWGRYTLLAGLTLAVLAMAAALSCKTIPLALAVALTAITHYYALFLLGLFLVTLALTDVERRRSITLGGLGGLALVSPWLWRVMSLYKGLYEVRIGTEWSSYNPMYLIRLLGPTRNYVLLLLALLGLGIIGHKLLKGHARSGNVALLVWTIALIGLLGPWCLGPFRPDHAAIVLFLPGVLLASEGLWILRRPVSIGIVVAALVVWGLLETRTIVGSEMILATDADVAVLQWIKVHTSDASIFLVDVEPWGSGWRGADGGWWIEPLTGRRTVLPPVVYGYGPPGSSTLISALARRTHALPILPDSIYCRELTLLARETGASYYYTRSGRPISCTGVSTKYLGRENIIVYELSPLTPADDRRLLDAGVMLPAASDWSGLY